MRIGIDVGGTNTDAVLLAGNSVIASTKSETTPDVTSGIQAALKAIKSQHDFQGSDITGVMIGTTHFINALVEANRLSKTAALRLGLPATKAVPPFTAWPERIKTALQGSQYMAQGGFEFNGKTITKLVESEIKTIAQHMADTGVESVAITSVFSPVNSQFEDEAAAIIHDILPDAYISLSSKIGRIGLLERENATIINASLRALATQIVEGLNQTLSSFGISAPLFLSQNDGTLMDVDTVREYPVATFASGPTNSMRGATVLSGIGTCAVVDVGGTTTDVGVLRNGFPREATTAVEVAGIRTNFRMPDVVSIGIGGGSIIHPDGKPIVGPDSVGYRLSQDALIFGGKTMTASDIVVAAGRASFGDPSRVSHIGKDLIESALADIATRASALVDTMRTSSDPLPVLAVGGGSVLLPDHLEGIGEVIFPENYAVANAVGAAIAQVSGEVDRIFAISPGTRTQVLDDAKQEAVDQAVGAGADPSTVQIADIDEIPIPYLPGNAARIRVKAVGDLNESANQTKKL